VLAPMGAILVITALLIGLGGLDRVNAFIATHVNLTTGIVWRRVKHFSGYNISSGLPCDPSPDDPDCIDTGGPTIDQ